MYDQSKAIELPVARVDAGSPSSTFYPRRRRLDPSLSPTFVFKNIL